MSTSRHIAMLKKIPKKQPGITTAELQTKLDSRGFVVTKRTIQRDLNALSSTEPLVKETIGKKNYWFYAEHSLITQFPSMDTQTALTFRLIEENISLLLPPGLQSKLQPHFKLAQDTLRDEDAAPVKRWTERVMVIPGDQPLIVPEPDEAVSDVIRQSLFDGQAFVGAYVARNRRPQDTKTTVIHPLGIVYRGQVAYLIGRRDGEDMVKQFALHRFHSAEPTGTPVQEPADFDLDRYVREGNFEYPEGKDIRLKLRVHNKVARILEERRISEDQSIVPDPKAGENWQRLSATTQETAQLRWWLLSFGDNVEVLGPAHFRKRIGETIKRLASWY